MDAQYVPEPFFKFVDISGKTELSERHVAAYDIKELYKKRLKPRLSLRDALRVSFEGMILFVFNVGHSVYKKSKPTLNRTHHWRFHVESWSKRYPLSAFVDRITFKLHDTFANPVQVVTQEPFAIEEDGFGTFALKAEVSFLDHIVTLDYELILFDRSKLHAFRSVRLDPGKSRDEWAQLVNLGGIPIPRSASYRDVCQQILRRMQTPEINSLTPTCFYPSLSEGSDEKGCDHGTTSHFSWLRMQSADLVQLLKRLLVKQRPASVNNPLPSGVLSTQKVLGLAPGSLLGSLSSSSTTPPSSQKRSSSPSQSASRNRLSREARSQALANLGALPNSTSSSPGAAASLATASTHLPPVSSSSASTTTSSTTMKHKKKLQLKHEAQLRLEGSHSAVEPQLFPSASPTPPLHPATTAPPKERIVLRLSMKGGDPESGAVVASSSSRRIRKELKRKEKNREKHREKRSRHKHKHRVSELWSSSEDEVTRTQDMIGLGSQLQQMHSISKSRQCVPPTLPPSPPHSTEIDNRPHEASSPSLPPFPLADTAHHTPPSTSHQEAKDKSVGDSAESEAAAAEVDPQLATMVWIAHLKGGPQPLVSPLQPPPSPSPPPPLASPDRSRKRSDHESFPSRRWSPPPAPGHDTRQPKRRSNAGSSRPAEEAAEKPRSRLSLSSNTSTSSVGSSFSSASTTEAKPSGVAAAATPEVVTDKDAEMLQGLEESALQELFARFCHLSNECMAYEMACLLKRYDTGDAGGGAEVLTPSGAPADHPQIIAFNLRKLPLECLVQMTELIVADERMTAELEAAAADKKEEKGPRRKHQTSDGGERCGKTMLSKSSSADRKSYA